MSSIYEIMDKATEYGDACWRGNNDDADEARHDLRSQIAAALADAERKGAEAMREAAAAMPDASASRLMQAKRVPMVDQHCAGILRDHADKIRSLPLPTGSQS